MGNCHAIDSASHPNKDLPFTNNMQMLDNIYNNCPEYNLENGLITKDQWFSNTPANIFSPNNICFENNNGFFGLGGNESYRINYTISYCENISNVETYEFFILPQDNVLFREIVYGKPIPEWDEKKLAGQYASIYNANIERLEAAGFTFAGGLGVIAASKLSLNILSFVGKIVYRGLVKPVSNALKSSGESTGESAEAGEGTTDEFLLENENPVFDQSIIEGETTAIAEGESGGEASIIALEGGAEVAGEAAGETFAASGLLESTLLPALEAFIPYLGPLSIAAIIVSGFSDDFKDLDCLYDDESKPTRVSSAGCCRGHCAIKGTRTSCYRTGGNGFNGSLFACCFQDYDCQKNKGAEYNPIVSDNNSGFKTSNRLCFNSFVDKEDSYPKIATCNPYYRNLGNGFCAPIIQSYCNGLLPFGDDQTSLMDAWTENGSVTFSNDNGYSITVKSPCLNFVARQLVYGTAAENTVCSWQDFVDQGLDLLPEEINPLGLETVQQTLNDMIENYLVTHGSPIGAINQDDYIEQSDFLSWFFGLCKKYPFLCGQPLTTFCQNITVDDLIDRPEAIPWCGCYMQEDQYAKYTNFQIDRECTPFCNRPDVIPLVGGDGVIIPCTENSCVIDDTVIKLTNSVTEGAIDFNQVCGSCGGSKITKKYNSAYQFLNSTNKTKFLEIAPLTSNQFNNLSNIYPQDNKTSIEYKNTELIAYVLVTDSTFDSYPFSPDITYSIKKVTGESINKVYTNVKFNLGDPIITTGSSNIIRFISSLTNESVDSLLNQDISNSLDTLNYKNNIFEILKSNGDPITTNGNFYFKINFYESGQHKQNGSGTVDQTYLQNIANEVSIFGSDIAANSCSCVIQGNLDFVNSQISGLNLSNNCSSTDCRDSLGNRIPCSTNNTNINDGINISNNIISSVEDNVDKFNLLTETEKQQFISVSSLVLFVIAVIMNFLIIYKPRKYIIFIITGFILFIMAIIAIYLYYSQSFGLESYVDTFTSL